MTTAHLVVSAASFCILIVILVLVCIIYTSHSSDDMSTQLHTLAKAQTQNEETAERRHSENLKAHQRTTETTTQLLTNPYKIIHLAHLGEQELANMKRDFIDYRTQQRLPLQGKKVISARPEGFRDFRTDLEVTFEHPDRYLYLQEITLFTQSRDATLPWDRIQAIDQVGLESRQETSISFDMLRCVLLALFILKSQPSHVVDVGGQFGMQAVVTKLLAETFGCDMTYTILGDLEWRACQTYFLQKNQTSGVRILNQDDLISREFLCSDSFLFSDGGMDVMTPTILNILRGCVRHGMVIRSNDDLPPVEFFHAIETPQNLVVITPEPPLHKTIRTVYVF